MTPEQKEHVHKIVDAVIDGKIIEHRDFERWTARAGVTLHDLKVAPNDYRIKPETVRVWEWRGQSQLTGEDLYLWEMTCPLSIASAKWTKTRRYIESEIMTEES